MLCYTGLPTAQQAQPPPTRLVSQTTYSSGWNDPPPTTFKNPALNSQVRRQKFNKCPLIQKT